MCLIYVKIYNSYICLGKKFRVYIYIHDEFSSIWNYEHSFGVFEYITHWNGGILYNNKLLNSLHWVCAPKKWFLWPCSYNHIHGSTVWLPHPKAPALRPITHPQLTPTCHIFCKKKHTGLARCPPVFKHHCLCKVLTT